MNIINRFILMLIVSTMSIGAVAQTSYMCDFEDATENSQWMLNQGVFAEDCINEWYIDTVINNGGKRSLYISADGGSTAGYVSATNVIVSYRELVLPAGDYYLSFDWQVGPTAKNALYICWVPTSQATNSGVATLPKWVEQYAINNGDSLQFTSSNWKSSYDTIHSDGTAHKLVFVWHNRVEQGSQPGACVDNISIFPLNTCSQPHSLDVVVSGTQAVLAWQGDADSYDIRYRSSSLDKWFTEDGVTTTSVMAEDLPEGEITLYVRSNCGDKQSVWVSASKFIFFKGVRCIDYLDLTNRTCQIGSTATIANGGATREMKNYGPYSVMSRHTVHYDKRERDPRTLGKLSTVPPDALASVRLGNWDVGREAESVEYRYMVDTAQYAILLLQYAVVLENPGHPSEDQPRFTLSIRTSDGEKINNDCGEADFTSGSNTNDWEIVDYDRSEIHWKPWTTVGVNLGKYHNQEVIVTLTTAMKAATLAMPISH